MASETIKFKDGNGILEHATYIEPVQLENSVKHKITRQDGNEYLVDDLFLSSIHEPELGSVPATVEQYASELPKLTRDQLHQIAHPETLDDEQRELMHHHYRMNHIPFPALIWMAESGRI